MPINPSVSRFLSTAPLLAAAALSTSALRAAEITWVNTATTGGTGVIYNIASNWSDGLVPAAGNTYLVTGTNRYVRSIDGATSAFTGGLLTFTGGSVFELFRTNGGTAISVAVNGNGLVFDNATLRLNTSTGTINFNINQAVTIGNGGLNITRGVATGYGLNAIFNNTVSGTGNINWTVDATGANTSNELNFRAATLTGYSGNVTVNGPSSDTNSKFANFLVGTPGWGSGNLTINRRATLQTNTNQTTTAAVGATVAIQGSTSASINLASGSKLILSTLVLRDGAYTQAITNNTGEVQIRDGGTLTLNAGTVASNLRSAFRLLGNSTWTIGDVTSSTATDLTLGDAGDSIKYFNLYGAGTLTKTGAGTVALSGTTANFTGTLDWQGGVLNVTGGTLGSHALTFASGTLFQVSAATDITAAGSLTGAGGLNKSGAGTLTLNAANLTGTHTINAGKVVLAGTSVIGGASTTVAAGAVLEATAGLSLGAGQTLSHRGASVNDATAADLIGNLSLAGGTSTSSPGATLTVGGGTTYGTVLLQGNLAVSGFGQIRYDLGPDTTLGAGSNDLLRVSGDVAFADNARLLLSGGTLASSTYRLLTYTGTLTGFDNLAVAFSAATRSTFTKVHDEAAKAIDVLVTSQSANLRWTGSASQSWDVTTTSNFTNLGTSADDVFFAADNVAFDGLGTGTVTLASGLTAGAVTVSGDQDYTLAGGVTLAATTLAKSGASKLTLATPVTISSSATLSGGTLELATGATLTAPLSVATGATLSQLAGTLAGSVTLSGGDATLAGGTASAAITVNSGQLTLSGATATGLITVAGGSASLTGGTSSGGLTVTSGAASLNGATLSGAINVNGGSLTYLAAGTFAGSPNVAAGGEIIFSLASGTQTLTGLLGGGGLVTKRGAGTLVLNPAADSTFGGSLVVEAGVLQLSDGSVASPNTFTAAGAATGSITVKSGAILDLPGLHADSRTITWADLPAISLESGASLRFRASTGNDFHATAFNLSVAGTVTIDSNGGAYDHDITHAGALTGSGQINYLASSGSGSGTYQRTLTLTQANSTFSGNWFVDYTGATADDHIELRSNAAGSLGTGTVTLDDRARLINNAANGINSLAGVSLLKSTATLNLSAQGWTNSAATLAMTAGTVTLGAAANSIGSLSGAGGTIEAGSASSSLTVNQTAAGTFGGVLASTAGSALAFAKTGSATLTLTGASTAAGTFAVNQGKVVLSGGENRLSTAANITVAAGATLEIASTNALRRQDPATQGTLTLDGGTLLISGASTTGAHLGALTLANGASLAATVDAGTYFGWHVNLNGDVTVSGTSNSAISASIGLLGSRTFDVADVTSLASTDLAITGAIRDSDTVAGALVKTGAGTLYLAAASAYTGGTTVSAGGLVIGDVAALGTGAVTLSTGGLLDLAGLNPLNTIIFAGGTVQNAAAWTGTAALTAGSYEAADLNGLAGGAIEVRAGASADLAGVTKNVLYTGGSVSGLDAYTRTLTVTGGTLDLSPIDFSFAPLAGTLEVRSGGTIDFGQALFDGSLVYRGGTVTGANAQFDALVTGANVLLANGAITNSGGEFVIGAGQSAVLGAGLTDTVRLAGGTITGGLLGPTGFAGLLIIEGQGVLTLANPALDPALTGPQLLRLRDGGRLAGIGDLGTAVVASGGILAPGNSPGTLAFNGNLQLETLGILQFEVASVLPGEGSLDNLPIPGEQYDLVTVAGELNLANLSPTQRFLLELISLDGFNQAGSAPEGWVDSALYEFTLIDYATLDLGANTPGANGDITNLFTIDADGFLGSEGQPLASAAFRVLVDADNSRIVLTYAPIPEPSTYGLALGALALAAAAVRRRQRNR